MSINCCSVYERKFLQSAHGTAIINIPLCIGTQKYSTMEERLDFPGRSFHFVRSNICLFLSTPLVVLRSTFSTPLLSRPLPFFCFPFSHSASRPFSHFSPFPPIFPNTVPSAKRGPGPVPGHAFPKSKTCIMPITYIPLPFFLRIHTRIQNTYIQKTPRKNITPPTEKTMVPETSLRARIRIYGNTEAKKTGRNVKKTSLAAAEIIEDTKTLCQSQGKKQVQVEAIKLSRKTLQRFFSRRSPVKQTKTGG